MVGYSSAEELEVAGTDVKAGDTVEVDVVERKVELRESKKLGSRRKPG